MADNARRRAFTSLIAVACADKKVNDAERQYLYRKAREFGIPSAEADNLIREGLEGRFTLSLPPTPAGKQALLQELIEVACVDGRIEQWESHLLMRFASTMGISPADLGERVRDTLNRIRNAPQAPPPQVRFVDEPRREVEPPKPVEPPPAAARPRPLDSPMPARVEPAPKPNPLGPSPTPGRESLLSLPPGPIKLNGPSFALSGDLPPVTRELVKNVIRFDGRDEAVDYIRRTCGVPDLEKARAIVDKMIAEDPECRPGAQRVKTGW